METRYISIYKIPGANSLHCKNVILLSSTVDGVSALLTEDGGEYLHHLRCKKAIGRYMLAAIFSKNRKPPREGYLEFLSQEDTNSEKSVLLIVEAYDKSQLIRNDKIIDFGKVGARLDLFDLEILARKSAKALHSSFAGLTLVFPEHITDRLDYVGSAAFAIEPVTCRPIYNMKIHGSGNMIAATPLGKEAADSAAASARTLYDSEHLQNVTRLLSRSSEAHQDQLMSFLSAWASLELFVQKVFKAQYGPEIHAMLEKAAPPSANIFVARIQEVMADKFNIRHKFVAVASCLDPVNAEKDIENFKSLKDRRDELAHEFKGEIGSLPVKETRRLLRKYLYLHLNQSI